MRQMAGLMPNNKIEVVFVKKLFSVLLFLSILLGAFSFAGAEELSGSYQLWISVEDWGAVVSRAILALSAEVSQTDIDNDTFSIMVSRRDLRGNNPLKQLGSREVLNAYVSDAEGNSLDKSNYITIDMKIGPDISTASALNYATGANVWIELQYLFSLNKPLTIGETEYENLPELTLSGMRYDLIDKYDFGMKTYGEHTLRYAYYEPKGISEKRPLLVWLHGGGEGGNDPTIPLAANKATVFADAEFQDVMGGAYVLIPQSPTYWMDSVSGNRGDGTSIYTEALMELIKDFVADNNIDEENIIVGGLSNGGYLTLVLAREYPEYFSKYVPVCEALADSLITDENIKTYSELSMWFVTAKTDTVVVPEDYTIATYERIKALEPKDVHFSLYEDKSGLYFKEGGEPYEYQGHWSWIYVYNNDMTTEIDGEEVSMFEWLSK